MFLVKLGNGDWIQVEEILGRWYTEDQIFVKVELADNRLAILRYDAPKDRWMPVLTPVRKGDSWKPSKLKGNPEWATMGCYEGVRTESADVRKAQGDGS